MEKKIGLLYRKKIGLQLRIRREELGMKQKDLAKLLNCTPSRITEIENGQYSTNIDRIVELALALKIDSINISSVNNDDKTNLS